MDRKLLMEQLNKNRTQPIKKKEHWTMVELGQPVQISKVGGGFYESLVVVRSEGKKYAIAQFKGKLPKQYDLREDSQDNIMKTKLVDKIVADIVDDAIETWIHYKNYHLNAYNFIITYCLVKGVDLVKIGVIDL